jgi:hypothetical protein
MLRKMLKTANGPDGVFMAGQSYDFERDGLEKLGQQLEDAGAAIRVPERAAEPPAERAVEAPAEAQPPAPEPEPEPAPERKKAGPKKPRPRKSKSKKVSK